MRRKSMIDAFLNMIKDKKVSYDDKNVYFFNGSDECLCIQDGGDGNPDLVLTKIPKNNVKITIEGPTAFSIVSPDNSVNAFFTLRG